MDQVSRKSARWVTQSDVRGRDEWGSQGAVAASGRHIHSTATPFLTLDGVITALEGRELGISSLAIAMRLLLRDGRDSCSVLDALERWSLSLESPCSWMLPLLDTPWTTPSCRSSTFQLPPLVNNSLADPTSSSCTDCRIRPRERWPHPGPHRC